MVSRPEGATPFRRARQGDGRQRTLLPLADRRPSFRRVEARAGGALDWATPATIGEFPDLDGRRDYHYDGSDFDDDGL